MNIPNLASRHQASRRSRSAFSAGVSVGAAAAFWAAAGEMPAMIEVAAPALNNWIYSRRVSTCIFNKRAGKRSSDRSADHNTGPPGQLVPSREARIYHKAKSRSVSLPASLEEIEPISEFQMTSSFVE